MAHPADKGIIIIAGPNGAGKTTFATEFLPNEADCLRFVNADLIAAGLAPFAPEAVALKAGRIMLGEIRQHVRKGASFAFETTLSGRRYARLIPQWQSVGYRVKLFFLKLESPKLAISAGSAACAGWRPQRAGIRDPEAIRGRPRQSADHLQALGGRVGDVRQLGPRPLAAG